MSLYVNNVYLKEIAEATIDSPLKSESAK